tara:strand:- start:11709 stop:14129 length:2421 start_codon:yes stop_codon:yes gene_type:complete
MPNLPGNTGYWKFSVYNVYNSACLSAYALEQTPLRFVPDSDRNVAPLSAARSDVYSDQYILWDFGDGSTNVHGFSAEHYYYYPGQYKVTMNLMLSSGEAVLDSFNRVVTIKDFVPNTYSLSLSTSDARNLSLTAGKYSDILALKRWNSLQTFGENYSFFMYASGSRSLYYDKDKLTKEPYAYLLPTHRFIQRELVGNKFSDTITHSLTTVDTMLYGKLQNSLSALVVATSASDPNAFFVGTSGNATCQYVDDTENSDTIYLFATPDTSRFPDNYTHYYNYTNNSTLPIKNVESAYFPVTEVKYERPAQISITSNGLDGEGFYLPTFQIAKTKFKNSPISFVAKLKYSDQVGTDSAYTAKPSYDSNIQKRRVNDDWNPNRYALCLVKPSSPDLYFENGDVYDLYDYTTIDYTLFKEKSYGFLKGFITIPQELKAYGKDDSGTLKEYTGVVQISAAGLIWNNICGPTGVSFFVGGVSSTFSLYSSKGVNRMAKQNENFDMTAALESYAFQPVISQSSKLWDPFMSTIVGTVSSATNAIGKRIYEKTSGFIPNNINIDTCDINNLFSYAEEYNVNLNDYASSNLLINYPADLSRLVNLFSIKKSLLWGRRIQYNTNFQDRYNLNDNTLSMGAAISAYKDGKTTGNNLGPLLSNESALSASEDYCVAKEIFSNTFKLVPTNLDSVTANSFALSTILDLSAGWGLTIPDGTTFHTLSNYYSFYRYYDIVPGEFVGNIINWDDTYQTTINLQGNVPDWKTYLPSYLSSFQGTPLASWDNLSAGGQITSRGSIVDQNLSYQLSKGLRLLSATP